MVYENHFLSSPLFLLGIFALLVTTCFYSIGSCDSIRSPHPIKLFTLQHRHNTEIVNQW